jgi:hypothetical protein
MYETVAVALNGDRTQDLTFSGTTSELGRTLSGNGSGRIGRLERATFVVGSDTVVADTIVVVADSVTEPAFAAGGFLRDQVSQYNDFAIRQALLSREKRATETGPLARAPRDAHCFAACGPMTEVECSRSSKSLWVGDSFAIRRGLRGATCGRQIGAAVQVCSGTTVMYRCLRSSRPAFSRLASTVMMRREPRNAAVLHVLPERARSDASKFYDFGFEVRPSASGGSFGNAGPYGSAVFG